MVGWHHQLNGHEFEQTPGNGEGQGEIYRAHGGFQEDEGACRERVRPGSTEAPNLCVKRPLRE